MAQMTETLEARQRPGILQLALPAIFGNLLYGIVGLVQTKAVGSLGAEALAAVGAGQRVFFALQAVMMAIGAGTTALVARAWGRNDEVEAGRITTASLAIGAIFGLVLTIPGVFFSGHVASIFGLDAHTVELAAANIRWLSIFNVAFAANFIMGGALRAAGDAWTPLYVGAFVNVVNIPLLYALVFGLWGAPHDGCCRRRARGRPVVHARRDRARWVVVEAALVDSLHPGGLASDGAAASGCSKSVIPRASSRSFFRRVFLRS